MKCIKCGADLPDGSLFCYLCGKKQIKKEKTKTRRCNGTGSVYKRRDRNCWEAEYVYGFKADPATGKLKKDRVRKSGFKSKKEAIEYLAGLTTEKSKPQTVTLNELFEFYKEHGMQKLSGSKQTAYKTAYKKLDPIILHSDISCLTIMDLQNNVDAKATSHYTAKDMRDLLSNLYKIAVAQRSAPSNLAPFIALPELQETKKEPFTVFELKSLWEHYRKGDNFTGYILLMIYTGMMPGELFNLKADMINFERRTITGCGMKTKVRKEKPIVFPEFLSDVLLLLCTEKSERTGRLVPMHPDHFRKLFDETLAKCRCRPLKPYSCRHTTATALEEKNISPSVIKEVMRHSKITMTDHYIHADQERSLNAVDQLDSFCG